MTVCEKENETKKTGIWTAIGLLIGVTILWIAIGWIMDRYTGSLEYNYPMTQRLQERLKESRQQIINASDAHEWMATMSNHYYLYSAYKRRMDEWQFDQPENCPSGKEPLLHPDVFKVIPTPHIFTREVKR